jgi:hypothetical protein
MGVSTYSYSVLSTKLLFCEMESKKGGQVSMTDVIEIVYIKNEWR